MFSKLTPLTKAILGIGLVVALYFGYVKFVSPMLSSKSTSTSSTKNVEAKKGFSFPSFGKKEPALRVCLNTWVGFAPGVYYNGGLNKDLKESAVSRFSKDGVNVEFFINDDFENILNGWKADKYDIVCNTADVLPTFFPNLTAMDPKVIMQIDWSRGGDVMVANSSIKTVADLKGKRVAVAFGSPSQTLLLWILSAGGLKYNDIKVVKAPTAIDAASYFKSGDVDAALVWSPDDQDLVAKVQGAHILRSTKDASATIADIFYAKQSFIDSHQEQITKFVRGWFTAVAEINASAEVKAQAQKLMATTFNVPEEVMNLNNARFCTYGDNVNFFNLNGDYAGTKGEDLYEKTTSAIPQIALVFGESLPDQSSVPTWRSVTNTSILKSLSDMTSVSGQNAEAAVQFAKATVAEVNKEAFATKRVTINFETGAYQLSDDNRYMIDKQFGDIAKSFARCRVRIEGNTDNVGSRESNILLSQKRAQSVADYLTSRYGFDSDRFITVGNGPDKPIASNATEEGRAQNRNTAFELIGE